SRRNVDVRDAFVTQRPRDKERPLSAKRRVDIPARQVTAHARRAVDRERREDEQNNADWNLIGFQNVSEPGKARRRLPLRQAIERTNPVTPATAPETSGQQVYLPREYPIGDLASTQTCVPSRKFNFDRVHAVSCFGPGTTH